MYFSGKYTYLLYSTYSIYNRSNIYMVYKFDRTYSDADLFDTLIPYTSLEILCTYC